MICIENSSILIGIVLGLAIVAVVIAVKRGLAGAASNSIHRK